MNFSKVLVIQEKMIGDVLISTIICHNIKKQFPNAEVHYLVAPNTFPVIQDNPYIDQFVFYGDMQKHNLLEFYDFVKAIRTAKYDLIIDAYGKIGSNLICKFSNSKHRIGYREKDRFGAYTEKIPYAMHTNSTIGLALDRRVDLLKPLMNTDEIDYLPHLYLNEKEISDGKLKVQSVQNQLKCMVSLFGSSLNKTYPENYMVKVLDTIAQKENVCILLNYLPNQEDEANRLIDKCLPETKAKINHEIFGKGLRDFIVLMNACDLLIGNDGGAVNIAKALNKPTFTIFSPWIPKEIWSILEDGKKHIGVHLKDYQPQIFADKSEHYLKNNSSKLYDKFEPQYFEKRLINFIQKNS